MANHGNVHPADRGKSRGFLECGGASEERERQHQLHYGKRSAARTGLPPAQRRRAATITFHVQTVGVGYSKVTVLAAS
jgi:hypothetical protein